MTIPLNDDAEMAANATFEALLQQHAGIVLKIAYTYSRTKEDRDDLGQEICAALWQSFARYDRSRPFATWMYRVGLNVAISQVRRARTRDRPSLSIHHDAIDIAAAPPPEPDPRLSALDQFIQQTDPLNRALLLLYLDERSYAEIADVLGITETNVATKISRLKQVIRRDLSVANETAR
ncbi:MAG: sigma-70 family RNA polymerase sigma factor [Phycisphaerae bacterium]|nr:sigma-70 family RNA polymerase sigma factor [Phycisphaerae bacterium]